MNGHDNPNEMSNMFHDGFIIMEVENSEGRDRGGFEENEER